MCTAMRLMPKKQGGDGVSTRSSTAGPGRWNFGLVCAGVLVLYSAVYRCVDFDSTSASASTSTPPFTPDRLTTLGIHLTAGLFAWVVFLLYDLPGRPRPLPLCRKLGLFAHVLPGVAFTAAAVLAQRSHDYYAVWLAFLIVLRYWRTAVQVYFWNRYAPAVSRGSDEYTPQDCTVVCATVGPAGNEAFDELVASVLINRPAGVVFACNTAQAAADVRRFLQVFRAGFEAGTTAYQRVNGLRGFEIDDFTAISVLNVGVSNKRVQLVAGFKHANTPLLVCVDDTVSWTPGWLGAVLPAFNDEKVGLVGTRKWVKRLPWYNDVSAGPVLRLWHMYASGFWNTMGGLYLTRHNFEVRSTNAADGGVFCISARSSLMRAAIVQDPVFCAAFTGEYILPLGTWFRGFGPLAADDDSFITGYVLSAGWKIKAQVTPAATMTTTVGGYATNFKFPAQCVRWSRSTMRQNTRALLVDRTVWSQWPVTVWITYLPLLYNAALFWDGLAVSMLVRSELYAASPHPYALLFALLSVFQLAKLIKTCEWWRAHPTDFVLYFVIPAYPLFTYAHSLLKVYTALTFWNTEWSGRPDLPEPESAEEVEGIVRKAAEKATE